MDAFHRFERLALDLHWAARLAGNPHGEGAPLLDGVAWQTRVHELCDLTRPTRLQGPGKRTLFANHGASGLHAEFDAAIDYGAESGLMVLIEAKAHADRAPGLRRDQAFVFTGKARDHIAGDHWSWGHTHLLFASAGRLPPTFCRWSFYEGIDVTDPDRFPLSVLARTDSLLPEVHEEIVGSNARDTLLQILDLEHVDPEIGPALLRHREGKDRPLRGRKVLSDLERAQAQLTGEIIAALSGMIADYDAEQEEALLESKWRELQVKGIHLPQRPPRIEARAMADDAEP